VTVGEPDHNPAAVWAGALRLPSSSAIRRWPQSGGGVSIHTGGRGRGSAQVHQITVGADLDRLGSCGQRAGPRKTPAGMTMCPHRDRVRLCVVRHSYSSRETQTVAITGLLILKGVQPSMWALRVISLTFLVRRKASDKPSDYAPRLLRSAPDPARQRMWPDVRVPDFLGPGQTKSVGMACKRSAVRARLAPQVRSEIRMTRTASTAGKYSNGGRMGRRMCVRIGHRPVAGTAGRTPDSRRRTGVGQPVTWANPRLSGPVPLAA
jgi:hypothetical protein